MGNLPGHINATARGVRWKPLRKILLTIRNYVRGWAWSFADTDNRSPAIPRGWYLLGEFQTQIKVRPELGEQNQNRINNMQIACSAISGIQINPGQIFSLAKAIGEPSSKNGYLAGPVIHQGHLESSLGGGLCQVSTTVFNAALMANMEILEKHHHSTDIWGDQRMVDLGRDATFAYLRKDLMFRNSLKHPVVFQLEVTQDKTSLIGRFWAPRARSTSIRIVTQPVSGDPKSTSRSRIAVKTERIVTIEDQEQINYRRIETYEKPSTLHRDRP